MQREQGGLIIPNLAAHYVTASPAWAELDRPVERRRPLAILPPDTRRPVYARQGMTYNTTRGSRIPCREGGVVRELPETAGAWPSSRRHDRNSVEMRTLHPP